MIERLRRWWDPHDITRRGRWCPIDGCGARFKHLQSWALHIGLNHPTRARAMIHLMEDL